MNNFVEVKANAISISRRKLVLGVGINDSDYITDRTINGKRMTCPFYVKWKSMLDRCYSDKHQAKNPTYIGATVADEWLTFSNFKAWMSTKAWKGMELDKDIIKPGNKHYSSDNCCFVTRELNRLLNNNDASRGDCPKGVYFKKETSKYESYCNYNGKRKHLGYHATPEAASLVYRKYKHALVTKIAIEQTDERVEHGLMLHAALILKGDNH